MINFFKSKNQAEIIASPAYGSVYKLQEGKDPVFLKD